MGKVLTRVFTALVGMMVLALPAAMADELHYKPINPSFGGSPFNGAYLLNNAQEQRQFDAPEKPRASALEEFQDNVTRALMSEVSRKISDEILGENAKDSGTFSVGSTTVNFHRQGSDVIIDMSDASTGGQTQITLPVPTY